MKKVVVITGASAGVGRALAQTYAKKGARIGLIARGPDGLQAAKKDVENLGGEAIILQLDVADAEAVEAAAEKVESAFGPIGIWINNAMLSVFSPFKELTPEEFKRVTEVTYLGFVYGTMAALKRMLPRNRGVIVQVGSALAYRAIPLQSAYCGAKHAVQGFTESIRSELIHDRSNVRIVMVQLPAVNTPQFSWVKSRLPGKPQPVPPIYQPEPIAAGIAWAAENIYREMGIGLSTSIILTGNKFFPGFGDWYLAKTGYQSQQMNEPADPNRPHNLWKPVPGDHGAHGDFDNRAHHWSAQLWMRTHAIALLFASGISLLGAFWYNRSRKK